MPDVSELKTKGLKGSVWNFLSMMINQLRNFIVTLILARLLTPVDFGLVSMAMVLNAILDTLADFGFSNAIIRKNKVTDTETSTVFWINILIGGCCTLLVFICAPVFAWFYDVPQLRSIVAVTSMCFLISSFGTLQTALFQRSLNFRKPFIAKLISGVSSGILGIVLAIFDFNVWALVYSNLAGWIIYTTSIWFMSSWRPKFIFNPKSVSDMFSFGWKMTLSTLLNRIIRQLDTLIIGKLYSASTLGLFNRAQSLNNLVIEYSFSSIRNVLLPSLSKLQNDLNALKYSVLKLLHVISFLTFLFAGLMYVCAEDLILFLYGKQWEGSIEIFKILGLFSISLCLPIVFDTILTVVNRMTMYLGLSVFRNILVLCAIPIGLYFGFKGYIWAISIAGIIKIIPSVFTTRSTIGLPIKDQLKSILSYVFPFASILIFWKYLCFDTNIYILNLLINGSLFAILYITLNFLVKNDGIRICKSLILGFLKRL
ncbi:lipopolysaccharide biosynthesis protein [Dysgonomonas termitidis]|uniref:Lipopolysaccharide biosynthesis protein n=1 Tax=Dysgonomonas termitidis TaxID=1516126 RepID=A0ABV9KR85_9BACT